MRNRRNKYGNVKTAFGGKTFDSKKEAHRYAELLFLQNAGKISALQTQPRYPLLSKSGFKIADYVADFEYVESGRTVTEDVKSPITRKNPVYRMKKKFFEAEYGRPIREI